jgi:hypothetical protein
MIDRKKLRKVIRYERISFSHWRWRITFGPWASVGYTKPDTFEKLFNLLSTYDANLDPVRSAKEPTP